MCIYTALATDKKVTRKLTFPSTTGSHCFGFLIVDQNQYVNIYAVGRLCGVKTILKTEATNNAPALSGYVLSVPLEAWSSVFLITTEPHVNIS